MAKRSSSASTNLSERFWRVVIDEVARANIGIDPLCQSELEDFIKEGVTKLTTAPTSSDIGAELKLRLFAREMTTQAVASGLDKVTKSIFDKVKGYLCPLFPFC